MSSHARRFGIGLLVCALGIAAGGAPALALINLRFTPVGLARCAKDICLLDVSGPKDDKVVAKVQAELKGKAPAASLTIDLSDADDTARNNFPKTGGVGMMFLGGFLIWRKQETDTGRFLSRWWLRLMVISIPLPLAACEFGWVTAEVGRQPWIVYKLLKTQDAASITVGAGEILFSIIMFGLIYLLLGAIYVFLLTRKVRLGPEPPVSPANPETEVA